MRVTVMGLGLFGGGEGAARHFASPAEEGGPGVEVTVTDLRDAETLRPAIEALSGLPIRYVLGRHDEADFTSCDVLVVNPGVRPGSRYVETARRAGARVTTEFELGLERAAARSARVLAVTGTNGKTTTAGMLASILTAADPRTRSGGNLGGSLLVEADSLPEGAPLVLEVSSFQLHRLTAFPGLEVAVITNLSPNHLDWHASLEAYYAAKRRLLEFLPPRGCAILNEEDEVLRRWRGEFEGHRGGLFRAGDAEGVPLGLDGDEFSGGHDLMNWAAAELAARSFGASEEDIARGREAYRPPRHRLEVVVRAGGICFIDDSACTTPESAVAALAAVEHLGPVALIAGGSDKGCSFDGLAREIARRSGGVAPARRVAGVAVMGEAGARLADALRRAARDAGGEVPIAEAADLETALGAAVNFLPGRGTVLLSPAAASLDEFRNYVERGERFADTARRLGAERAASNGARPPGR